MNGFGGDGGIEEFKERWNWNSESHEFWSAMEHILALGGTSYYGGDAYNLPYVSDLWPDSLSERVFDHAVITGERVNLRISRAWTAPPYLDNLLTT